MITDESLTTEHTGYDQPKITYRADLLYTDDMKSLWIEISDARRELGALSEKLKKSIVEKAANFMPKNYKIEDLGDVDISDNTRAKIKARVRDLTIDMADYVLKSRIPVPKPPVENKPHDPYERIRNHPNFIQILNSGVLTKKEKRRILELPDMGEQNDQPN